MAVKNYVQAIPMTTFNSAGLGAYQVMNVGGLSEPCFLIRIINDSNTDAIFSFDGINDNDVVVANTTSEYNFQTNSQPKNYIALMKQGTIYYIRGAAGVGNIYLVGFFQPGA